MHFIVKEAFLKTAAIFCLYFFLYCFFFFRKNNI